MSRDLRINMEKIAVIIIMVFFVGFLGISGCIDTNVKNETWGQKNFSLDSIVIVNNTTGTRFDENTSSSFLIDGYVKNYNNFEALDIQLKATTYSANGSVFATNDTFYLMPKTIPANGVSNFQFLFDDPQKKIVRYDVTVVSVKAEY